MKTLWKVIKWWLIASVALAIVIAIVDPKKPAHRPNDPRPDAPISQGPQAPLPTPPIELTATTLAAAYEDNTVAADLKFKGKKLKVSGSVAEVSTDITGRPYVVLVGTNLFQQPQAGFSKDDITALAALKKGQKVILLCEGAGDIVKTAMLHKCAFANKN